MIHLKRFSFFAVIFMLTLSVGVAGTISPEQAQRFAAGWLALGADRLGEELNGNIAVITPFADADGTVLYYYVALAPQGFLVLAAHDYIEPVIAFSDHGDITGLSDVGPFKLMLDKDMTTRRQNALLFEAAGQKAAGPGKAAIPGQNLPDLVRNAHLKWQKLLDPDKSDPTYYGSSSVNETRTAPLLQSEWNQQTVNGEACYNYYAPPGPDGAAGNYYIGCVATAMAQVMRYFTYPTAGIGVTSYTYQVSGSSTSGNSRGSDGSGNAYNWSQMPLKPATSGVTSNQRQMIGSLCYDCAITARMNFTPTGSGAQYLNACTAMKNTFGFGNIIYAYSGNQATTIAMDTLQPIIDSNLAADLPIMLGISRNTGSGWSGHAVICDGHGYTGGTEYHHINMGWGGAYDAWYSLPTIDAATDRTYTVVDSVMYNIFTNGTGELISGRVYIGGDIIDGAIVTATAISGGTTYTATTDANGYYGIQVPSLASYQLTASNNGSRLFIKTVAVGNSANFGDCGNYWDSSLEANVATPALGGIGITLMSLLLASLSWCLMKKRK